ncbi:hypothetical protein [Baaleninema sp.]|uniref:hypothetical protein n=1 Tax=Baaleninema sp. TaxID=3101197 RepID=UPI003CFC7BEF
MTKFYRDDILQRFGVGKDTFYKWKRHLCLEGSRDENKAVYFTEDDIAALEVLKQHLDNGGKLEDFNRSALAISSDNNLSKFSVEIEEEDLIEIPETPDPMEDVDLDRLVYEAAELKGQQLVTPQLVKLAIAGKLSEDELPDDIKAKVRAVREAANPKYQADSIAFQVLSKWRSQNGRIGNTQS